MICCSTNCMGRLPAFQTVLDTALMLSRFHSAHVGGIAQAIIGRVGSSKDILARPFVALLVTRDAGYKDNLLPHLHVQPAQLFANRHPEVIGHNLSRFILAFPHHHPWELSPPKSAPLPELTHCSPKLPTSSSLFSQ